MNPEVIQFSCGHCQHVLTVPANLSGISGPCPVCGNTVTSPSPTASAAAPAFSEPSFSAPPVQPQMPSYQPAAPEPAPSYGTSVMPLPGVFPTAPQAAPSGLMPQGAAPSWQNPGFGQTMMEAAAPQAQPQFLQPQYQQPPAQVMPAVNEGFLPQRRMDGQTPFSGNIAGAGMGAPSMAPAQPSWNNTAPPPMPSMGDTHLPAQRLQPSSLIPGASSFPTLTPQGADAIPENSLLGRRIPSAPLAGTAPLDRPGTAPLSLPPALPAQPGYQRSSRPLYKPKKATNVFMIGLALLFLGGFLVAAGWLFREPILQVVQLGKRYLPGADQASGTSSQPEGVNPAASPGDGAEKSKAKMATRKQSQPPVATEELQKTPAQVPEAVPVPEPMLSADDGTSTVRKAEPVELAQAPTPTTPAMTSAPGGLVEVKPISPAPAAEPLPDATTPAPAPAVPELAGAAKHEVQLVDVSDEAKPAAEALKKFLSARNLQERLDLTLAADVMRPIMEQYYAANPAGPILVDAIALVRYDPKPQVGGGAHAVFGLESRTWEFPVPVMLEMNEGRFKVDWLSFVEFKDRLLEKFLVSYQEGPARFHVGITRTHYFEDKVPNTSNKDAFRIGPPPPNPYASVVFVDRDSDVGRELRDKIPWGAQVWAIVELEWTKLGSQNWVQLAAVPQLNWYSVPSAPKAQRALPESPPVAEDAQVPTETQKAVPVGRTGSR